MYVSKRATRNIVFYQQQEYEEITLFIVVCWKDVAMRERERQRDYPYGYAANAMLIRKEIYM